MNVVSPLAITHTYHTNSMGTELARRDNNQKELIPALTPSEKSAVQRKPTSELDRATQLAFNQPIYDKASLASKNSLRESKTESPIPATQQKPKDEEAEQAEQKKIAELKARDTEVRMHEQAHAAVGGQYAGSPTYEYEKGPDGNRYAVAGEVQIDVSEESEPEDTVRKMQQVKAAALAPAEPSAQDYKVASEATQKEQAARSELSQKKLDPDEEDKAQGTTKDKEISKSANVVSGFYAGVGQAKDKGFSALA